MKKQPSTWLKNNLKSRQMKQIISLVVILFVVACGNSEKTPEAIKNQIKTYKEEISNLENKIAALEEELAENGEADEASKVLIKTKTISKEPFAHYVEVSASLEAVNSAFISPEISGQVQTIHVSEGQFVRKGQLLVSLDADIINASIKELETSYELAKTVFAKQEELWNQKIGSEIQYLEAKNNKESLESKLESLKLQRSKSRITAPISGIIDKINIKKGELAVPGAQIIQLVNIGTFYVNADVSEKYIPVVKRGNPVTIGFPTFPDWEIETSVYRTSNIINQSNRTFQLQARVNNKGEKLKPNMLATVTFQDFAIDSAMVVPSILVKEDFKGNYIYLLGIQEGKSIAQKRYVKTSYSNDTGTMITNGINVGDKVIVEGYNFVQDGIEVDVKK
jgi:RND family efflux transporter MFP subunit